MGRKTVIKRVLRGGHARDLHGDFKEYGACRAVVDGRIRPKKGVERRGKMNAL